MPSTDPRPSLLVVDDDQQIREALVSVLTSRGYKATAVGSAEEALAVLDADVPDLLILDIGLPVMSGLELCRQVRRRWDVPILMLTVRDGEEDKIAALDLGADDYLTKPAKSGELVARIRALLRRSGKAEGVQIVRTGDLVIDLTRELVTLAGEGVSVTPKEWAILSLLAQNQGRPVPLVALRRHLYGPDSDADLQLIRVHVANLRKKIEPHPTVPRYIMTEPKVGFRLA